tara:strand:+ start:1939 stop:3645 length:1707 start_codon:yes stop_codon:yes gene_type:complete
MSSILKVDTIQDQAGNNIINESGNVITIGASGDTITVPAGATVSGFTSVGIDDNATSVAITIDSSERVGIGTSSPSQKLEVNGNIKTSTVGSVSSGALQGIGGAPIDIDRFELGVGFLNLDRDFASEVNQIQFGKSGTLAAAFATGQDYLAIKTNGNNERARFDASGNFMVGKTASNYSSPGVEAKSNGNLIAVRDSGNVVNFIRNTNDGSIVTFSKDTTNFGSIGVKDGNNLTIDSIASNHCGIEFDGGSYIPRKNSATADNAIDLGTSSSRYKNLYLGGQALVNSQSTGTPSFAFLNDPDTGISRPTTNAINICTGGSERLRVDASGNLFVAKTSSDIGTDGIELRAGGDVLITNSGAQCMYLNRKSSDGSILELRKDGTAVGSIGVNGDNLVIDCPTSAHTGLDFANDKLIPRRNSAAADNTVDLGYSGGRFKDIYLGGGVFLGGTGTANKLSDYEEGTWTPGLDSVSSSNASGQYTKIGNVCTAKFKISSDGTGSGVSITGFPFTSQSGCEQQGGSRETQTSGKFFFIRMAASATTGMIIRYDADVSVGSNSTFEGQITYITNT